MSENFDSKLQDIEKNEDEENNENKDDEDDKDLDKEMGETEEGVDQLDEQIWGDDKEEEEEEDEKKEKGDGDEQGSGEQTGEKEMGAKEESNDDDDKSKKNKEDEDKGEKQDTGEEKEKEEINEINEPDVNDDQVNPYHGNHEPQPEPEPMDLPEDLNLDDEEIKENQNEEENPFDIDAMKEAVLPPEKEEMEDPNGPEKEEKEEADKETEDSSDEEGEESATLDLGAKDLDENEEDANETENKGKENEKKEEEEEKKAEDGTENEKEDNIQPSLMDSSDAANEMDQSEEQNEGSRDKVAGKSEESDKQENSITENNPDDGNDSGTGQANSEEMDDGHSGATMRKKTAMQRQQKDNQQIEKRKNPGESDNNHALMDHAQPDKKKQKMINSVENESKSMEEEEEEEEEEEGIENDENSELDLCQHVKNSEIFDGHALDAATEEQAKQQQQQQQQQQEEEEEDMINEDSEIPMEIEMHQDEKEDEDEIKALESNAAESTKDKEREKSKASTSGQIDEATQMESKVDVEGDIVETVSVERAAESSFHTNLTDYNEMKMLPEVERTRSEVEKMLGQWTQMPLAEEALKAWNCLSIVTESPARDLSEKLRLVLEPTQATRLKGDYRTGKRINMRKIIPYIASQFRKDKIWLRRTKPSKRDYQIVLALDDSSSMADNHSKELAFESLSLISKAMGYLEVGQLGVISFGEHPKVLHPLGEPFNEQSGSRLIQEMRFDQKKTMMGELLNFTVDMFENERKSNDNAKLLVVLSDGRGIFSEGPNVVNRAVRRAKLADIFLVFIIVENPMNKDSILDIRMPVFEKNKVSIRPYMDQFPFPFYMILKDIGALPCVLSDALRQWFEIVGKIDS